MFPIKNIFNHLKQCLKNRAKKKRLFRELDEARADLKKYSGSNYTKIKFDTILSDYQINIIHKIIELVKGYVIKEVQIKQYWTIYKLPMPVRPSNHADILNAIHKHSYFCIQDNSGKYLIDYFNHRNYKPSLYLNEHIRALDRLVVNYRNLPEVSGKNIVEFSNSLMSSLIFINNLIFQFHLNNEFELGNTPTLEESMKYYPTNRFFRDAVHLSQDVRSIINSLHNNPEISPSSTLHAVNAFLLMEKQKCAFSALCGLMLDATAGTSAFFYPLRCIENHIRHIFHDSELYRLELPAEEVNTRIAIGSRGPSDHTTRMKMYLIDEKEHRIIVRIDLPHIRDLKLHFNIESPDTGEYKGLNHAEIEALVHNDSLVPVLEILHFSIKEQMPNLHLVVDTTKDTEKRVLEEMEKLITYRQLCLNYIVQKDYKKELRKVAGYLKIPNDDIDYVLQQGVKHFAI